MLASTAPQAHGHVPVALWLRGPRSLDGFAEHTGARVGGRAATDYGQRDAYDLAAEFAEHGWTMISGGAYGIEASADRGALEWSMPATVAVTVTGIDRYYPTGNQRLLEQITTEALMISEYHPRPGGQRSVPATESDHRRTGACGGGRRGQPCRWQRRHRPVGA